jgi:hypothetical protein
MDKFSIVKEKLRLKEHEILVLEDRLREARGYVKALREVLGEDAPGDRSMAEIARDIIITRQHSVHITELLRAMGRELTRENKVSLTSVLAAYVRRGEIFTRLGPNQFGLLELGHVPKPLNEQQEPPADFGDLTDPPPNKAGNA